MSVLFPSADVPRNRFSTLSGAADVWDELPPGVLLEDYLDLAPAVIAGTEASALTLTESLVLASYSSLVEAVTVSLTEVALREDYVPPIWDKATWTTITGTWATTTDLWNTETATRADAGGLSFSETSALLQLLAKAGTDTAAFSLTESRELYSSSALADALALALTEGTNSLVSSTRTETGALSLTEAGVVQSSLAVTDTPSLGITEGRTLAVSSSLTDAGSLSITETTTSFLSWLLNDSPALGITEQRGIAASSSLSDSGSLSLSEATGIVVQVLSGDAGALALLETGGIFSSSVVVDGGEFSFSALARMYCQLQLTDGLALAFGEAPEVSITLQAGDAGLLEIQEGPSGLLVNDWPTVDPVTGLWELAPGEGATPWTKRVDASGVWLETTVLTADGWTKVAVKSPVVWH